MREIIGTTKDKHGRKVNVVKCSICGLVAEILPTRTNECRCQRGEKIKAANAAKSPEAKERETARRSKPRKPSQLSIGDVFGIREVVRCRGSRYDTQCIHCGNEREMTFLELTTRRNKTCAACKAYKFSIGEIVGTRRITALYSGAFKKTCADTECIECGLIQTELHCADLVLGKGCMCQRAEKTQATVQAVYGVDHVSQIPGNRAKAAQTMLERYGHSHAMQCDEVKTRMLENRTSVKDNDWRSCGERELAEFVTSLGFNVKHGFLAGREIDIIVQEAHIGIEYNGAFWHSEAGNRMRGYHLDKLEKAEKHGLTLLQIWEHQWLQRRSQVQNFVRSKLGKNSRRIGMRKCKLREISKTVAEKFVDEHHIQEAPRKSVLCLGVYCGDELLGVAMFSAHHRGGEDMVLSRICTKTDCTVSGFLSKATSEAAKILQKDIITWTDRCLSSGAGYVSAGFIKEEVLPPDYFYQKSGKVIKKQAFRKIDERTELQRAIDEGMSRVWDCGKIRFRYQFKGVPHENQTTSHTSLT